MRAKTACSVVSTSALKQFACMEVEAVMSLFLHVTAGKQHEP